ncbi:MAG: DUF362 domain-containing protein [Deltaproteobacteria bacterium]|nr:DUF362 domain-containing protein [Deltaproteobacteria bacterium]
MTANVYFADMRTTVSTNISYKIKQLLASTGLQTLVQPSELVAVKIHFGEKGNTAFIRPIFIRDIIDNIKSCHAKPFLTDTNTLYRGERCEAVSHTNIALAHGFNYTTVAAPVIIADGLRGNDAVKVKIDGALFPEVSLAAAIVQSDALVSVAHFKGHELPGFGGSIKNLGMGCASREGKLKQHCEISPQVNRDNCIGCGQCLNICPAQAIDLKDGHACISHEKCIGCAECTPLCPEGAIEINWSESSALFQQKMVEYACGILKEKSGKCLFLNFLMQISPSCDCYGHADRAIVPDIGILASTDPVAIDQASVDLVNAEAGTEGSALKVNLKKGDDKIKALYPEVDWEIQLDYAQKMGCGTRNYDLIAIT